MFFCSKPTRFPPTLQGGIVLHSIQGSAQLCASSLAANILIDKLQRIFKLTLLLCVCVGQSYPTSPTFIYPSHSSTKSFHPHSKCSDELSCLLVCSVYTFDTDAFKKQPQQLCSLLKPALETPATVAVLLSHVSFFSQLLSCKTRCRRWFPVASDCLCRKRCVNSTEK